VQVQVLTSQASLTRLREGTLDIGLVALPQVAGKGLMVTLAARPDSGLCAGRLAATGQGHAGLAGAAGIDSQRPPSCHG
jgi:hypothetical protein